MTVNLKHEPCCCFCGDDEDLFNMLEPYDYEGKSEIAIVTIAECFGIDLKCDSDYINSLYIMCKNCMKRLRDAVRFRYKIQITNDHMQGLFQYSILKTGENDSIAFETIDVKNIANTENITVKYEMENLNPSLNNIDREIRIKRENGLEIEQTNMKDMKGGIIVKGEQNCEIEYLNTKDIEGGITEKLEKNLEIEIEPRKINFYCYDCNREYRHRGDYNKHMKIHGSRDFICNICDKSFLRHNDLKKHIERHEIANLKQANRIKQKYVCEICGKDFAHKKYVSKHIAMLHMNKEKYICDVCGKNFALKRYVKKHIVMLHMNREKYRCNVCDKFFAWRETLRRHETTHVSRLNCTMCDLKFSSYKLFKIHEKEHAKCSKCLCDMCGRTFSNKRVVEKHIMTQHLKIGRILCKICNKSYASQRNLKHHLLIHEKNRLKRFQCDVCFTYFDRITRIREHMINMHLKIGSSICKICNRSFTTKNRLYKHKKCHGIVMHKVKNENRSILAKAKKVLKSSKERKKRKNLIKSTIKVKKE